MPEIAVPRYAIPARSRRWLAVPAMAGLGVLLALIAGSIAFEAHVHTVMGLFGVALGYSTLWSP